MYVNKSDCLYNTYLKILIPISNVYKTTVTVCSRNQNYWNLISKLIKIRLFKPRGFQAQQKMSDWHAID